MPKKKSPFIIKKKTIPYPTIMRLHDLFLRPTIATGSVPLTTSNILSKVTRKRFVKYLPVTFKPHFDKSVDLNHLLQYTYSTGKARTGVFAKCVAKDRYLLASTLHGYCTCSKFSSQLIC